MLTKIIPVLIFWGIFAMVILKVPYPETLSQASLFQLSAFFIPLYLALSLTFNIFLKNIFISGSISLGLVFLLILKALQSLNLVTGILIIVATYLLISYFRKANRKSLTNWRKIPKLTSLTRRKHE